MIKGAKENWYMFLHQEKIALVRKEDISTVSFMNGNLIWRDTDSKTIKMERMCSEFQRYDIDSNGNAVCIDCPHESGTLSFQQTMCVPCKELKSYQ